MNISGSLVTNKILGMHKMLESRVHLISFNHLHTDKETEGQREKVTSLCTFIQLAESEHSRGP